MRAAQVYLASDKSRVHSASLSPIPSLVPLGSVLGAQNILTVNYCQGGLYQMGNFSLKCGDGVEILNRRV